MTPIPPPPSDPPSTAISPCPVPRPKDGRRPDGTFGPGNPGRPPGTRNKATVLLETLFEAGAAEIGAHILAAVRSGNMAAARIAVDRIYPVRRGSQIGVPNFPKLETAADVPMAHAALIAAVAEGLITAEEAKPLSDLLANFTNSLDAVAFAERLAELERRLNESNRGTR